MPTYSENKFGVVQFSLLEEPSLVIKASGYRNQDRMSSAHLRYEFMQLRASQHCQPNPAHRGK